MQLTHIIWVVLPNLRYKRLRESKRNNFQSQRVGGREYEEENRESRQERLMKTVKRMRKILAGLLGLFLFVLIGAGTVQAASGNVYTCVIHPCYAHPVTGEIEDSGGEASYATGQGMIDGAVYTTGILELTDSGEYYLTIRMSLMGYTSGHTFWVQNVGDSGWSSPAMGITGTGTDNNGDTADICMQVPSENCVVRGSMYVEPMGRDVVFYLYPSDYAEGNNTDMNAAMVTSASGSDSGAAAADNSSGTGTAGTAAAENSTAASADNSSGTNATGDSSAETPASLESSAENGEGEPPAQNSSSPSDTNNAANKTTDKESGNTTDESEAPALSSSIELAAEPASDTATDTKLNDAQGLSLSTAEAAAEEGTAGTSGGTGAFAIGTAITVSGLILMGAAAVIVYFFRKNWRRWGGGYDDDEI